MKAVVYAEYGSPDVLHLADVPTPVPKDDEVLIKVHAASVNRSDWEGLTGSPAYARIGGLFRPRQQILGSDIAGRVEAVGRAHTRFQVGDEVYGDIMNTLGGFAEYVCGRGANLVKKPAWMTFEQASAIPQAGAIAINGIARKGVQPRHRILINGAGGGAGMFAIQMAKLYGAEVTGVDNGEKQAFMRSLGADHAIDCEREDFTRNGAQYDLILDLVALRSPLAYARALVPGGRYYAVGGPVRVFLKILAAGPVIQAVSQKKVRVLAAIPNPRDITAMAALCEQGDVRVLIDRAYPLDGVADALRYLGAGHAKGKIVIRVA